MEAGYQNESYLKDSFLNHVSWASLMSLRMTLNVGSTCLYISSARITGKHQQHAWFYTVVGMDPRALVVLGQSVPTEFYPCSLTGAANASTPPMLSSLTLSVEMMPSTTQ